MKGTWRMIRVLVVATALFSLSALGASDMRVDASSPNKLKASIQWIETNLSGKKKQHFRAAMERIRAVVREDARFSRWECLRENPSTCAIVSWYEHKLLMYMIGGKTADEIIAEAETL